VLATYGLTETGGGIAYEGRPLDGVEVRTAADGELEVRGPMLLRAYRDGRDPKSGEGWLPTGDLGAVRAGMIEVHGRRGDLIITGGENVWPAAVERVLLDHPAVSEVAVMGRPDPEWGQRVVAVVVPTDPVAPPDLAALRAHAKDHLHPHAAPTVLELVDALPRTALGKVRRSALTRDDQDQVGP
jgi:O-succinylbenzoic acid--CoA ligase